MKYKNHILYLEGYNKLDIFNHVKIEALSPTFQYPLVREQKSINTVHIFKFFL